MGRTKYYVPDKDFYIKMRGGASTLMERGTCIILECTGMHPSSLAKLNPDSLKREGDHHFIYWVAPKPRRKIRNLRARIPPKDLITVQEWLVKCSGRSRHWYKRVVQEVGERAGYPDPTISPMTYRHQRIVVLMDKIGSIRRVSLLTGATYGTIERHYAQADPQLFIDDDLELDSKEHSEQG